MGYLAAREMEYTNLRIILMGRAAGIDPAVIRTRLRASLSCKEGGNGSMYKIAVLGDWDSRPGLQGPGAGRLSSWTTRRRPSDDPPPAGQGGLRGHLSHRAAGRQTCRTRWTGTRTTLTPGDHPDSRQGRAPWASAWPGHPERRGAGGGRGHSVRTRIGIGALAVDTEDLPSEGASGADL